MISIILMLLFSVYSLNTLQTLYSFEAAARVAQPFLLSIIGLQALIGTAFFLISRNLLKNRLNLE